MGMNFHRGSYEGLKVKGLTNRHEGIHEGCQMKGENGRVSQRVGNTIEGSYTKGHTRRVK